MTKLSPQLRASLQPIIPDPKKHLRAMGQLAADAFSGGLYVDAFCNNYIGNSHYDWNVSRLVAGWRQTGASLGCVGLPNAA